MHKLSGIQVIVWDFDGTFYPLTRQITKKMERLQYETIARHNHVSLEKAKEQFWSVYPAKTTSGNEAVSMVTGIPTAQSARENELPFDRTLYVKRDPKLIAMFRRLRPYRHFVLGNGVIALLKKTSEVLGITPDTFEEYVTSEVVGVNKPNPHGFQYILKKTGLPPEAHLMVGDRESVDLAPAKKLGMHTCLVAWEKACPERSRRVYPELPKTGSSVDFVIPTVYDISSIL